jgi:S1-C subfamily serine protease
VRLATIDEDESLEFGLEPTEHVRVDQLLDPSPAGAAGVEVGDLILAIAGTEVATVGQILNAISSLQPGTHAPLKIWRDGSSQELSVLLEDRIASMPR